MCGPPKHSSVFPSHAAGRSTWRDPRPEIQPAPPFLGFVEFQPKKSKQSLGRRVGPRAPSRPPAHNQSGTSAIKCADHSRGHSPARSTSRYQGRQPSDVGEPSAISPTCQTRSTPARARVEASDQRSHVSSIASLERPTLSTPHRHNPIRRVYRGCVSGLALSKMSIMGSMDAAKLDQPMFGAERRRPRLGTGRCYMLLLRLRLRSLLQGSRRDPPDGPRTPKIGSLVEV